MSKSALPDPIDLILSAAASFPDRLAIETEDTSWTYTQLLDRAKSYAKYFSDRGVERVAIALPQNVEAYAAFLGAGLAGAFYTPLNISSPAAKMQRIVTRLRPGILVADDGIRDELGLISGALHQATPAEVPNVSAGLPVAQRHKIAYVMFTSGSTGEPKGVVVSRAALAAYVDWIRDAFGMAPDDRVAQQPNLAFDISMTDIYAALCFGASLHPVASEYDRMMPASFVQKRRITVWNSTPSAISLMMRSRQLSTENFKTVRLVNFCGEPLFPEQVEAVFKAQPSAIVHNTYGPTEATVAVTCAVLTESTDRANDEKTIGLGGTLPHAEIELRNGPSSDEGEIVIFGQQLAEGYWEDPERTAAAFTDFEGRRGYKTGDWAIRKNGQLFFKERIDFQVKVRGFRIELDEVASAIRKLGWPVNVVFKRGEALAAVVEEVPGVTFDQAKLLRGLEDWVEPHAIPAVAVEVAAIPRNQNDKLDRAAAAQMLEAKLERRPK